MPTTNEPTKPNVFQHFLRGIDALKSTAMAALSFKSGDGDSLAHRQDLANAGTMQISLAVITSIAMMARVYQDPTRLKHNSVGLILRSGIVTMDLISGAMILYDLDEATLISTVGKSLMACSIFTSRLIAEDGHHDQVSVTEDSHEFKDDSEKGVGSSAPLLPKNNSYGSVSQKK